jgi:hypothetical protein
MSRITVLMGCVVVWGGICLLIHRFNRHAAWLAGATASAGLFLTGATVAASFMSARAPYLLPFWSGVAVLLVLHLSAARRGAEEANVAPVQAAVGETATPQGGQTVI